MTKKKTMKKSLMKEIKMKIASKFFWDNVLTKLVSIAISLKFWGLATTTVLVITQKITPTTFGVVWSVIYGMREAVKISDFINIKKLTVENE